MRSEQRFVVASWQQWHEVADRGGQAIPVPFLVADQGLAELEARFGQEFVERSCDRSATVQLDRSRPDELGTEYGSAIVPAFYRDEPERASFFWLLSTWNPYRVVLMKTQLVRPPG